MAKNNVIKNRLSGVILKSQYLARTNASMALLQSSETDKAGTKLNNQSRNFTRLYGTGNRTWLTPSNSGTALSTSLHLLLKLRFSPLESIVCKTLSSALNCSFTLRCVSCAQVINHFWHWQPRARTVVFVTCIDRTQVTGFPARFRKRSLIWAFMVDLPAICSVSYRLHRKHSQLCFYLLNTQHCRQTFGSLIKNCPELVFGGSEPVVAYFRHSMIVLNTFKHNFGSVKA